MMTVGTIVAALLVGDMQEILSMQGRDIPPASVVPVMTIENLYKESYDILEEDDSRYFWSDLTKVLLGVMLVKRRYILPKPET